MKNLKNLMFLFGVMLMLGSCINNDKTFVIEYYKDAELMENTLNIDAEGPEDYTLEFPSYYGRQAFFDKNDATLGRVMFYDKSLSADGTVSCASCHKQELAFSDDKAVSDGIDNQVTKRNSLALGAVFNFQEYYGPNRVPFFWDNSVETVEEQIRTTFASKNEMDMTMSQIVSVMNANDYYKPLIGAANGQRETITEAEATRALATFVNSLGSFDSKFDNALSAEVNGSIGFGTPTEAYVDFKQFTESENKGKSLYLSNCASCHGEIMGAPNELAANNGLEILDDDYGFQNSSQFKVPSLRNLTLTYPYMHDGRFATIEEVLDHYSTGLANPEAIHPNLQDNQGQPKKFNFTDEEKQDFVAFFKTLDDPNLLVDERFSDPFIR